MARTTSNSYRISFLLLLVLQLQDLRVLCNSLKEVSPSWNFIGLELQLPLYILKNIADSLALLVSGNEAYFREMLSTWLQSISEPEVKTVRRLKEALIRTSNDVAASNLLDEINHGELIGKST